MIYLDNAATSQLIDEARAAMEPWWGVPANPSSVHGAGQRAAVAVERARSQVAALLQRPANGIVFVSGATEANHQAVRGWSLNGASTVAVSGIEHPSVHGAVAAAGLRVEPLPSDASGQARLGRPDADLLCLMVANHETGVIQQVDAARRWVAAGVTWHADATQAAGKLHPETWVGAHSVAISAHKLGGPVGIGALSLTGPEPFPALFGGGAQERGRRAGTLNVAGIVGFGAAALVAGRCVEQRVARWRVLAGRLEHGLRQLGGRIVGNHTRLPSHCCAVFPGCVGELVVQGLDLHGIAVSSGAACASGSLEPSPVLLAMNDPQPDGAVRFSFGPHSSERDVERTLGVLPAVLDGARNVA